MISALRNCRPRRLAAQEDFRQEDNRLLPWQYFRFLIAATGAQSVRLSSKRALLSPALRSRAQSTFPEWVLPTNIVLKRTKDDLEEEFKTEKATYDGYKATSILGAPALILIHVALVEKLGVHDLQDPGPAPSATHLPSVPACESGQSAPYDAPYRVRCNHTVCPETLTRFNASANPR